MKRNQRFQNYDLVFVVFIVLLSCSFISSQAIHTFDCDFITNQEIISNFDQKKSIFKREEYQPSDELNVTSESSISVYSFANLTFISQAQSDQVVKLSAKKKADVDDVPFYTTSIAIIFYSLVFVIGFFGNALVILVALFNKTKQHNTHYCLVNLSIADLLVIIVCMPSAVIDLFSKEVWYLGYFLCKLIPWLENTIAHASILTIVAISIERALAIASPLKAKRIFTKTRLFFSVVLIWLLSILSSIPILLITTYTQGFHRTLAKDVSICFINTKGKWELSYLFIILFLFYMLPCLSLFLLYGKIVWVLKNRNKKNILGISLRLGNGAELISKNNLNLIKNSISAVDEFERKKLVKQLSICSEQTSFNSSKKNSINLVGKKSSLFLGQTLQTNNANNTSPNQTNRSSSKNISKKSQKSIITLLIIMMLLIFICLLPYRVFSLWSAMATKETFRKLGNKGYNTLLIFCRVTFYINSALNPIFYHIISSKFQDSFKKFFTRSNQSQRGKRTSLFI
jgi:hypothetical protein